MTERTKQAEQLILEITRSCNMACAHCMRGDAQELEMSREIIRAALAPFGRIGTLTFSGGEPSLNVSAMAYALKLCQAGGIQVGSFYVVTNGKKVSNAFLRTLDAWYLYCLECSYGRDLAEKHTMEELVWMQRVMEDDQFSGVALSLDRYHESIPAKNLGKLMAKSYFKTDKFQEGKMGLIPMGRAKGLPNARKTNFSKPAASFYFLNQDEVEELYVNAKGHVFSDCNLSYEVQDETETVSVLEDGWFDLLPVSDSSPVV